ncbi:hypothetical protein ACPV5H_16450 [Vibrio harveyi]|uniref:hypothetical protein n=1 Tax=Vibrio harveyi TaxID=669 RepID=UPI004068E4D3
MQRILTLLFFIPFYSFGEIGAYEIPSYGFIVDRARNTNSLHVPTIEDFDKDPAYPDWGGDCQLPINHLCINRSPIKHDAIPDGVKTIKLYFSSGSGYLEGVLKSNKGRLNKKTIIHIGALHHTSSRYYKLLLPIVADEYKIASDCSVARKTNLVSESSEFSSSVLLNNRVTKNNVCTITITSNTLFPNNSKFGIKSSGVRLGYDTEIYSKIQSGSYTVSANVRDRFEVEYIKENGGIKKRHSLSDVTKYVFSLKLKGYINYRLISSMQQNMTLFRNSVENKSFVFNGYVKSNGSSIDLSFDCQYEYNNACELRNKDGYKIIIKPGLRFDHLGGPHPEVYLSPGERIDLTKIPSFRDDQDFPLGLLFEVDSDSLLLLPNENLLDFSGSVTLILDADFM